MKASYFTSYGSPDLLELRDVEKPIPKADEILVLIHASAVNTGDVRVRKADPFLVRLFFGLFKPRIHILGAVFSGVIEAVGHNVKRFSIGDEVFGETGMDLGAHAQYKCLRKGHIFLKPSVLSHLEAATIPFGGRTASHFLKKAEITKGQRVLINGASGSVGTAAVQIAKSFGAEVTGICSTTNIDLVRSLGADHVIDYTVEDLTKYNIQYDVIFDTVNTLSMAHWKKLLKKNGTLLLGASGVKQMAQGVWLSFSGAKRVVSGPLNEKISHLDFLTSLVESGQYRSVIDRTYPLEQIAEAHAYVDAGHKKGNVAIRME